MKNIILTLFIFYSLIAIPKSVNAQSVRDFKTKNASNTLERSLMLDLLRNSVYDYLSFLNEEQGDILFVVEHFKVSTPYAWMQGTAQRKDGRPFNLEDQATDCCYVGALFKKIKGNWTLMEDGIFPTDVWFNCLGDTYTDIDPRILPADIRQLFYCD